MFLKWHTICLVRDPKSRPTMDEVVKALTPLQDLTDHAILSCHSRMYQQAAARRRRKPEGMPPLQRSQSQGQIQSQLRGVMKFPNVQQEAQVLVILLIFLL
ncbi:hypothetical protein MLD38_014417 [Melastoma candidum]|uniref:Uncharacterized protein n=1 Tax=Melastoma candidum TaxID=119954 RepID=A0ACB9RC25_9MYRT|nr:hypothetical protein MLD38_014417 [Melastoma candidum]